MTIDVNNTDATGHTGQVYVVLKNASGNIVSTGQTKPLSFAGGSVTSVTIDVTNKKVDTFESVEVRINETG